MLPHGGWRSGTLTEWLAEPGAGAVDLAFRGILPLLSSDSVWCVIDPEETFFAVPAWAASRTRCLIVRPQSADDLWWATEQVLRCPGVAVTWCRVDRVPDRVLRRWQLAAETGGGVGMLFRLPSVSRQRAWSDLRLSVTPVVRASRFSRTVRVEVLSCRGRLGGQAVMLELHHAPDALRLVSPLDDSTLATNRSRYTLRCAGRVG